VEEGSVSAQNYVQLKAFLFGHVAWTYGVNLPYPVISAVLLQLRYISDSQNDLRQLFKRRHLCVNFTSNSTLNLPSSVALLFLILLTCHYCRYPRLSKCRQSYKRNNIRHV